jgi:hypothetical protein
MLFGLTVGLIVFSVVAVVAVAGYLIDKDAQRHEGGEDG